ncbi:MAG TPA: TolC family protein [Opitutaceae bacterium]|nr:TolC family protein [Opitutaceae bacterium]
MRHSRLIVTISALLLGGCVAAPQEERLALDRVNKAGALLRPAGHKPDLPVLTVESSLADYLRFALLNHPQVEAAYDDWRGTALAIAPTRALPDPEFTFQADITNTLTSFMPGLMIDVMAPGKRTAMAREAAATSDVAYRTYTATVLRVAADVRKAWIELAYAGDIHRLYHSTISAAEAALALTNAAYATGRGMSGFEQQVRLQNLAAQHHAHHAAIADRLAAAHAEFKSALGLAPTDADPPWPQPALTATPLPSEEELWRRIRNTNAELAQMRAMVDMAIANVAVARAARTPDFAPGAMVDLKADPLLVRPTATLTLPIWRHKIAETIAAAGARRDAALARAAAEQLDLAAQLARLLSLVNESDRMLAYMDGTALPNLERSIASAEAGAQSGMAGAAMIAEAQLMAIDMRHERLEVLREREIAAADLMLLAASVTPAGAPLPPDADAPTNS